MRKQPGFYLLLLLFFLVACFINPVREAMTGDDGWAYALSVRTLHETGKYHLHDWAAANMPFQIYLGALFAQAFGFSFTILRFSTLVLLGVGLIALYWLLRDFGAKDGDAGLLALAMFSCPVVMYLSFTYQTDVQFLGWQILALWLYSRALRHRSYLMMGIASVAAFAAIGTRQFGIALLAGLIAAWLLVETQRMRQLSLYLVGLALPLIITAWQFSSPARHLTFSQKIRLAEQSAYMHDLPQFLAAILWRPSWVFQYLGLFVLPLTPFLIMIARGALTSPERGDGPGTETPRSDRRLKWTIWIVAICSIYVISDVGYRWLLWPHHFLMPYLDWLLRDTYTPFFHSGFKQLLLLTVVTCLTWLIAIVLGALFLRRYFYQPDRRLISGEEWFVVFAGVASLILQLLYVQFYDTYLIQFLPFTVVLLGKMASAQPRWSKILSFVFCLIMLSASTLWTRGNLERAEANWRAAELAHAAGAALQDIGGDMTWSCYYGTFDEWIAQVAGSSAVDQYVGSNRMHAAFFEFLKKQYARASYVLSTSAPKESDREWQLRAKVPYRDRLLERRGVYLLERRK